MKRIIAIAACMFALLSLSSCSLKGESELFTLPRMSNDNLVLQSAIDAVLADGAAFSAPISGQNQQNIQLMDIDDDGEKEALAFFKTDTEKPLKIYIFKKISNIYENTAIIEGVGTGFVSVDYIQLDGEPGLELLVSRQVSDQVQRSLTAYKVDGSTVTTVMSAACLEYKVNDLDSDLSSEILVFNKDSELNRWYADYYDCVQGEMTQTSSAMLSEGLETIRRAKNGCIEEELPAVFVSGVYQTTGIVTDILISRDGVLVNIAIPDGATTSIQTLKNYIIYPVDVNEDGTYEIARPNQLPTLSTDVAETYWNVSWYGITKEGELVKKLTTYHNYSESWFIILPNEWTGNISVSRIEQKSGDRALVFYRWLGEGERPEAIMTIYTLTGDDRRELAEKDGRFILYDRSDYIFAAEISGESADWEYMITGEDLISRFRQIRSEWVTGEIY